MLKPEESNILAELNSRVINLENICFVLAMRNDDGKIELYDRENQPCYGELRKYKSTHGDEATQPENRPGDLKHPFPVGKPEALAIGFPHWVKLENTYSYNRPPIHLQDDVVEFFDYLFSDESPFVRGFGGSKNIEWSEDRRGIVLLDLAIDPTVLVNLLKHIQMCSPNYGSSNWDRFSRYKQFGLSFIQAFCAMYTVTYGKGSRWDSGRDIGLRLAHNYVYPTFADFDRIVNQDPVDLTGGTLADRFDYSRKRLHEIFYDQHRGINVYAEMCKKAGLTIPRSEKDMMHIPHKIPEDQFLTLFLDIWNDYFGQRKEIAA
jgi:hypothetical protein